MKTGYIRPPGVIIKTNCSFSPHQRITHLPYGSQIQHPACGFARRGLGKSVLRKDPNRQRKELEASGLDFGHRTEARLFHWVEPGVGDYGSTYHRRIGGHSRLLSVVTLEMSRDYVGPRTALICYQRVLIKRPDSMLNGDEEPNVLGMSSRGLKSTDM